MNATHDHTTTPTAAGPITVADVHEMLAALPDREPISDEHAQSVADKVNTEAAATMRVAPELRVTGETVVHAAVVGGRRVVEYGDAGAATHPHGTYVLAGYVLRETTGPGHTLDRPYDIGAFDGAHAFGTALAVQREYTGQRRTVLVDALYECGCRTR
jgi:hypothetical protein